MFAIGTGLNLCCLAAAVVVILLILAVVRMISRFAPPPEPDQDPRIIDVAVKPASSAPVPRADDYTEQRRRILEGFQAGRIDLEQAERMLDELERK